LRLRFPRAWQGNERATVQRRAFTAALRRRGDCSASAEARSLVATGTGHRFSQYEWRGSFWTRASGTSLCTNGTVASPFPARMAGKRASDGAAASNPYNSLFADILTSVISVTALFIGANIIRKRLDPAFESKKELERRRKELEERLRKQRSSCGRPPLDLADLTPNEEVVAHYLVDPDELDVQSLDDVGGLEEIKEELRELVILPFHRPELFPPGSLLQPPKGILLYGPPGTGKTMLAKALAAESKACFLAISPATLLSKWVGETQQLTRAVFSLAYKIQPCIIFIDEIDALFRTRSAQDHEVYRDFKAEMMQLWDGLTTDSSAQVLVLGATNRPWDVDTAIQRRMPRSFLVDLPGVEQRKRILDVILRSDRHRLEASTEELAKLTEGYSGSDLRELCRAAALLVLRDAMREAKKCGVDVSQVQLRSMRLEDFERAMERVAPTGAHAEIFRYRQTLERVRKLRVAQENSNVESREPDEQTLVAGIEEALLVEANEFVERVGRRLG
jgi:ATP-dependent 26S proteasome regulatory subunit